MSTFIKDFIEREKLSRRNFLFASAAGLTASAMPGVWGSGEALAGSHGGWSMAWSYRDRASAYWNAIVSGGEAYVESLGMQKSDMVNLINEGSSEKSLADIKAFLAKMVVKARLRVMQMTALMRVPLPKRSGMPVAIYPQFGIKQMTCILGILVTIMLRTCLGLAKSLQKTRHVCSSIKWGVKAVLYTSAVFQLIFQRLSVWPVCKMP